MRYELILRQSHTISLWETSLREALQAKGFYEVFAFTDPESGRQVAQFRRDDDIASLDIDDVEGGMVKVGLESETFDLREVAAAAAQKTALALLADLLGPLVADEEALRKQVEAAVKGLFAQLGL